jgi:Flp pilus assembly protein TadB
MNIWEPHGKSQSSLFLVSISARNSLYLIRPHFSVVILFAILAATVFQIRRRQRQKRRRELGTDIENDKTPKRKTRAQDKRRRTDSVTTIHEIVQKHSHPVGVREDRSTEEIQKVFIHRIIQRLRLAYWTLAAITIVPIEADQ